ncbi:hypothetical protein Pla100_17720 [Neorhodopirellula pilleata]|uniref:Uncharacterized protein n=1 Tax=Neorhodopirellula pilleata TaxID=2714738 RepID=A0A5C6ASJ1_9BACT|nr:hypothetical protein Pla100_17720 [Neorhodopirellula pilleata]
MPSSVVFAVPFYAWRIVFRGQSYEHRRGWIRERLEFLASVFGIDCLTYTVMVK